MFQTFNLFQSPFSTKQRQQLWQFSHNCIQKMLVITSTVKLTGNLQCMLKLKHSKACKQVCIAHIK